MEERHLHEEIKIRILCSLVYSGLNSLDKTLKFKRINHNTETPSAIYAIWHGWQYSLLNLPSRKDLNILISPSVDGEFISRACQKLGFTTIRGSVGRKGSKALREILKALKNNKNIAYTVDGPKGPLQEVKNGIIKIAQMSQKPIIPMVSSSKFKIQANSWDKYRLPLWGSTVPVVYGDPIHIPKKINEEEQENYRLLLEKKLFELEAQADKVVQQ